MAAIRLQFVIMEIGGLRDVCRGHQFITNLDSQIDNIRPDNIRANRKPFMPGMVEPQSIPDAGIASLVNEYCKPSTHFPR